MIAHKTFAAGGYFASRDYIPFESARQQAEAFINRRVNEENVIAITESATASASSMHQVSHLEVTVWYTGT